MFLSKIVTLEGLALLVFLLWLQSPGSANVIERDMVFDDSVVLSAFALTNENSRWKSEPWGTTIYYVIVEGLKEDKYTNNITVALHGIERAAECVALVKKRWAEMENLREYILIQPGPGPKGCHCCSEVGKKTGKATNIWLDLDPIHNCTEIHTIQHEAMHALGYYHEHQRPDRDRFLEILTSKSKNNYKKNEGKEKFLLYSPYDYHSLMHYVALLKGKHTMKPYNAYFEPMLDWTNTELSAADVIGLNLHFNCNITVRQHTDYMEYFQYNVYQELKQLTIRKTDTSAVLRNVFL